jgi:WS/DGAT C-terminal domain
VTRQVYPLSVSLLGSNGKLSFGAVADSDLMPDVNLIIDALKDEFVALSDVVGAG